MGDTTSFELHVHQTTETDAAVLADFIGEHGLSRSWGASDYSRPTRIHIGAVYGTVARRRR